ncbi:cytochrome P450 [Streptomyces sp. NBC_01506]|uniref:cytochrome P450 family protein n=1 Tax=Streptomyces sp. NBC_01506 TaxID=2903887 RepID=UPI0038687F36
MSTPIILDTTGHRLYEQMDELRAGGPAVRIVMPQGVTGWSVSRGDIARKLLRDPRISKDARKSWPDYQPWSIPWLAPWVDVISQFTSDGADHARLKGLVGKAFTPARIEAMRPAVEALVDRILDEVEAQAQGGDGDGDGEAVDLRAAFSYQVPTRVICDLFGVPEDQRPAMLRVIDTLLDAGTSVEQDQTTRTDMFAAMNHLIDTKRGTPGDDMTSLLLRQHEDEDRLTHDELVSTLVLMIGAGSETVVALLNHAVLELLSHPDQLAAVLADPARWNDVIDETLRQHPPIMHLPLRYATEDIDLGDGVTIPKGAPVLIGFGGHGRDQGANPGPDNFRIDREDRQHLAFGHGIHYCLGAPLARLEAGVALPRIFARFPQLRLATPQTPLLRRPSFIGNDYQDVPVVPGPAA